MAVWAAVRWPAAKPQFPYAKRPSLLTQAEQRFYRVLQKAVPHGVEVLVKVRLMGVVSIPDDAWTASGAPGSG